MSHVLTLGHAGVPHWRAKVGPPTVAQGLAGLPPPQAVSDMTAIPNPMSLRSQPSLCSRALLTLNYAKPFK